MSEHQDDNLEQGQEQADRIADLRTAADEGKKAKRELAFVKAGIDTDTPLGAMFATAYTGDLTKEAIGQAWAEIAPPPPAVDAEALAQQAAEQREQQASQEMQQQAQDRARRGIGSTPAEPPPDAPVIDPLKAGYDKFHQNMADGQTREAAAKPVFEAIIGGAANGDQRFIWDGTWTEEEMREGRVSRA